MKKLLLATIFTSASLFAAEPLRLSTDGTYPPFSEINEKGEMIGFDIDIGNALCAEMKRECTWTSLDFDALISSLKANKVDVLVASMNANEERRKSVAFTNTYYQNPGIFVRAKGSKVELTPEGLKGKVIGVLRSSIFDDYVTAKFKDIAEIQRYSGQGEAFLDAGAGRVDVLFADAVVMHDGFLDRDEGKEFEVFGEEVNDPTYFGEGIAIAVRLEEQQLVEDLNKALQAIKDNGTYKTINDKYFKYDISGGK